jgi:hypothetical protein
MEIEEIEGIELRLIKQIEGKRLRGLKEKD